VWYPRKIEKIGGQGILVFYLWKAGTGVAINPKNK
jgi:hypothetical protein